MEREVERDFERMNVCEDVYCVRIVCVYSCIHVCTCVKCNGTRRLKSSKLSSPPFWFSRLPHPSTPPSTSSPLPFHLADLRRSGYNR